MRDSIDEATLDIARGDVELAVKRGAAFLDEKFPRWEHAIDLDSLELAASHHCVLGQLSIAAGRSDRGDYDRMFRHLAGLRGYDETSPQIEEMGFEAPAETVYREYGVSISDWYRMLQETWERTIIERTEEGE